MTVALPNWLFYLNKSEPMSCIHGNMWLRVEKLQTTGQSQTCRKLDSRTESRHAEVSWKRSSVRYVLMVSCHAAVATATATAPHASPMNDAPFVRPVGVRCLLIRNFGRFSASGRRRDAKQASHERAGDAGGPASQLQQPTHRASERASRALSYCIANAARPSSSCSHSLQLVIWHHT